MKKRLISFILFFTVLTAALLLTACGENKQEDKPSIDSVHITLSIDYPKSAELEDVEAVPFAIEENSSVLEAIQLYCNVNEIPVTIEMTSGTVVGINDLLNGDIFASRTWQFKVNGKLSDKPAGEIKLSDGDSLEWVYIR